MEVLLLIISLLFVAVLIFAAIVFMAFLRSFLPAFTGVILGIMIMYCGSINLGVITLILGFAGQVWWSTNDWKITEKGQSEITKLGDLPKSAMFVKAISVLSIFLRAFWPAVVAIFLGLFFYRRYGILIADIIIFTGYVFQFIWFFNISKIRKEFKPSTAISSDN